MVRFFGRTLESSTENDTLVTVFEIPAFSEMIARNRGKVNARLKDLSNYEAVDVQKTGEGDVPRQSIYEVTVESER